MNLLDIRKHHFNYTRHFEYVQVNDEIIDDLCFSFIKELQEYDEDEKFIFFYHKDHLGSSTQISDRDANIIHHLEYMHFDKLNVPPSGEQFSEQRDSWSTPYKFNDYGGESFNKAFDEHTARSAELDAETGLYYYGARYYTPEIGIWLSVDPMSDERPSLSPYNYCQLNPIVRVDPSGMLDDEFGVTSTGEVKLLKRKSGDHELYKLDNNGKKVDVNSDGKMSEGTDFVKFGRKDVKSANRFNISIKDHAGLTETGRSFGNNAEFSNQESAENIFNFITCQKNTDTWKTDVEYALADLGKGNSKISLLTTGRSSEAAYGSREHVLGKTDKGFSLTRHIHNHTSNNPNPSTGENGDIGFKASFREVRTNNALFQIKTKHGLSNY